MGLCETGSFAGWTETDRAGLQDPYFFLHFLFYFKKNKKKSEKKAICVTYPEKT